ncbi:MAG TPA: LapA family protein [Acidimicrobiales bacterium]|nr:LapA family protein [Acidimicrobiales bacterium]
MADAVGRPSQDPPGTAPGKKREPREIVRIVVAVVGLILLVAFVLDNSQTVKVGFVFHSAQLSLIWVLLIAAVLGALVDRLVILLGQRRRSRAASKR